MLYTLCMWYAVLLMTVGLISNIANDKLQGKQRVLMVIFCIPYYYFIIITIINQLK